MQKRTRLIVLVALLLCLVPVVFLVLPVTVVFAVFPGLLALRLDL